MGEVYRATDTKLGRDVAVKMIAPALADDAARMASFSREAHVLASLNHPNIAAIYGVEDRALVMELVEGPTLAERIKQGPIPLDEALAIARQIADALAAAHDKGIVHRDLKPANIKITPDGIVKLLDFGLAKAAAIASTLPEETATVAFSMAGAAMIVGTPGYMAPEQARGQLVDKRADIWSFGVVLYEMVTGTTMFAGDTITDVMAAVVREEPDLSRVPARVRPLLRRCLEKDPKRRLRDIGDAMLLLDASQDVEPLESEAPRRRSAWLAWGTAAVLALALAAVSLQHFRETSPAATPMRFQFRLPEGMTFTQTAPFAVSPDGTRLVFPAVGEDGVPRIWIHEFSRREPRALTEVQPNPLTLVWSPDSRQVLYSYQDRLLRVDVDGGRPQVIVAALGVDGAPGALIGAAWNRDGTIVYGSTTGVMKVPAAGGMPEPLTTVDRSRGEMHMVFSALPGGAFLYTRGGAQGTRAVFVGSPDATPDEQSTMPLLTTDHGAIFVPSPESEDEGHLLFMRDFALLAQPFNARARQLSGDPITLASQVFTITGSNIGVPYVSASQQGTLIYRTGQISDLARQLVWYSRDGKPLGEVGERARYGQLKLSPDGAHVVASQTELSTGRNPDIWITNLATQASTRFTFAPGNDAQPTWSPDGRYVAWASVRDGEGAIYRKRADGAGEDELLYKFPKLTGGIILSDWSADGFLVFALAGDIFALPIGDGTDSTREPITLVQTPAVEFGPDLSPDSRWLVYISNESGRQELYAVPFAPSARRQGSPVAGKWMVSNDGTLGLARWRNDGKELLFTAADGSLMAIEVTAGPAFQAGPPRRLFGLPRPFLVQTTSPGTLADVAPDGQRVLLAMPSEETTRPELSVVLNWQGTAR
jgi:Tol biopolymer transport system component